MTLLNILYKAHLIHLSYIRSSAEQCFVIRLVLNSIKQLNHIKNVAAVHGFNQAVPDTY